MRHALRIQSALGLKILLILETLLQTTEDRGEHTSLPTTSGGALAKRAYLVHRDREVSPTGNLP